MRARNIKNYLLMLSMVIVLQVRNLQATPFVYITDNVYLEVLVVDVATNSQIAAIPITGGAVPTALAATPDGTRVYVVGGTELIYINTTSNTVAGSILMPALIKDIAITPDGSTAYVIAASDMYPVDLTSNVVGAAIPVASGFTLQSIAITPDGSTAYVTASRFFPAAYNFYPIDLSGPTVGSPVNLGSPEITLSFIAIAPNGNTAYVANTSDGSITPIDITTPLTPIVFPRVSFSFSTGDIAIAPDGATAYVTMPSFGGLRPFNLSTPLVPVASATVLGLGLSVIGVGVTPDGTTAYTASPAPSQHYATPLSLAVPLAPVAGTNIPLLTSSNIPAEPYLLTILSITQPPPPTPEPAAPTNVTGVIRTNTFINMTERFLIISWTASSNTYDEVVSYRIYRGNVLVGTVLASDPLCFKTCLRGCDCGQSYFVAAVDADGVESNRISVEIQ